MKRILFFIESLAGGGAEKVLVTLLNHLNREKYDVTLLTLVDTGVFKCGLDMTKLHYRSFIHPSANPVVNLWNKLKYKLVYHYIPISLARRWILPLRGYDLYVAFVEGHATKLVAQINKAKVAWVHSDLKSVPWTQEVGIFKNIQEEKEAYNCYNKTVCVSQNVEQIMRNHYGLFNTITLYNPIDIGDIIGKSLANDFVVESNGFNVVSIGRLVKLKGYDKLIPMIKQIRVKGINIHLYIIGEGEESVFLVKLIHTLGLYDCVHMLGFLNNPYSVMRKMDAFVCSSRAEGFSLVIAEAIVLGIPVISMNCAGPNELLDGGRYGCLCQTYDELEHALFRAATDKSFLMNLRKKSEDRKTFLGIQQTMATIEHVFDTL